MMAKRGNPNLVYHDQRHPAAHFTDAAVRRIRHRVSKEGVSAKEVAQALGVHPTTIWSMVTRRTYGAVQ